MLFHRNVLSVASLILALASSLPVDHDVEKGCTDIVTGTPSFVASRHCRKGDIEWMSSTRRMEATFDPDDLYSFTVCIAWYKGALCDRLLDQSSVRNRDITPAASMEENQVCVPSVEGQAKIVCTYSDEPTVLMYTYSIVPAK